MVKAKPKTTVQVSPANILGNGKTSRAIYDKTWNAAAKAPMFSTIRVYDVKEGKKRMSRTARLISANAYKIAASGAAMHAGRILASDCKILRTAPSKESSRAPWLPTVSSGARMLLEQFLCALAQEAAYKAHAIRQGSTGTQRLGKKHAAMGWEVTAESVFASTSLMPSTVVQVVPKKKPAKSAKKEKAEPEDMAADGDASGNINDITGKDD